MEYLNFHVSVLDSFEFKTAEPAQQATWLKLNRYCASQENGGQIHDCKVWTDRDWATLCGVTTSEVHSACKLFWFDDADLTINFYPVEQEKQTKSMRKGGKIGNQKRWGKQTQKSPPDSPPDSRKSHLPDSPPESITERNGTEANVKKAERPPEPSGLRNYPDVPKAIEFCRHMGMDYTEEEIRGAWLNLAAAAVDGMWVTKGKTPRPVSDWRVAIESEMATRRQIYAKTASHTHPSPVSASVAEISKNKKIAALEDEERSLSVDLRSLRDSNIAPPPVTKERLQKIRAELAQLKGTAK